MIAAIVAVDINWGIGCNHKLLVHLPEDMKFFKSMTTTTKHKDYKTMVVCGRKTYESIPNKPLSERKNVVLTRKSNRLEKITLTDEVNFVRLETFREWLSQYEEGKFDIFIIGGGEIYKELLDVCEKVFVTKIEKEFEADTFFPNLDRSDDFILVEESKRMESSGIQYYFTTYAKKKRGLS